MRQQLLYSPEEMAEQWGADRADADSIRGRRSAGGPGGVGEQAVDARQDGAGPAQYQFAEGCGDGAGVPPVEQGSAQHGLDTA
ncbi:hypothetical protein [Streptomyces sp. NBC_01481]|uniref:hypothetical protein n=1 Tax=Streptomyces sp. NBC_01481 TaxID=2975869 RepID=UPI00224D112A|nr:hypothetical protein [Streptomyces sp. NBC_01481]MCX4584706.1 hypothetical protein [Streptomyces sp. NBC_01481]